MDGRDERSTQKNKLCDYGVGVGCVHTARYCDGLPGNMQLDASPDECRADKVPVDTECQLSCVGVGFELVGDDTRLCQFDGVAGWKPEQWPSCVGNQRRYTSLHKRRIILWFRS